MNLFTKASSVILITGVALSSLATVSTFAVESTPATGTATSQTNKVKEAKDKVKEVKNKVKDAKTEVKEAKKAVKTAKKEVKKAVIVHKLQTAENGYNSLIKKAEAKNLDTTKIKANIETLKAAELKLKTDQDSLASKDILTADRAAIKSALKAINVDAKALRMQLAKK